MKALTLTQPWASLVAIGAKRIETRSWKTAYRGPLAIHAAKGFPKDARRLVWDSWIFYSAFEPKKAAHYHASGVTLVPCEAGRAVHLPLGAVVATCQLVACKFITSAMSPEFWPGEWKLRDTIIPPQEPERTFGDYSCGRYAWFLEDVKPLAEPIPAKGALSLWEWDR